MQGQRYVDMTARRVRIAGDGVESFEIGAGEPLALIAGPCVIEDAASCLAQAKAIAGMARDAGFPLIFKASFDKANRTSASSFRGIGIDAGLEALSAVRRELGVPVLTDVHTPEQVERVAATVDVVQIPAFLCRQTDLLTAAGRSGKPVNIKKGQFLSPDLMEHAAAKVVAGAREAGGKLGGVLLTERGVTFGYGDLVVDMRALAAMASTGWPVVFDATHSVQKPGGRGSASGGDRGMLPVLTRAAVAAGIDCLFIETHPAPAEAKSDAETQLPHADLPGLLAQARAIRSALDGMAR
jgi:2-dehydro-3-deoxyphosphooctonate aldolase (KDO 8-P synthase)